MLPCIPLVIQILVQIGCSIRPFNFSDDSLPGLFHISFSFSGIHNLQPFAFKLFDDWAIVCGLLIVIISGVSFVPTLQILSQCGYRFLERDGTQRHQTPFDFRKLLGIRQMVFDGQDNVIDHIRLRSKFIPWEKPLLGLVEGEILVHPYFDLPILVEEDEVAMHLDVSLELIDGFEPYQCFQQHSGAFMIA